MACSGRLKRPGPPTVREAGLAASSSTRKTWMAWFSVVVTKSHVPSLESRVGRSTSSTRPAVPEIGRCRCRRGTSGWAAARPEAIPSRGTGCACRPAPGGSARARFARAPRAVGRRCRGARRCRRGVSSKRKACGRNRRKRTDRRLLGSLGRRIVDQHAVAVGARDEHPLACQRDAGAVPCSEFEAAHAQAGRIAGALGGRVPEMKSAAQQGQPPVREELALQPCRGPIERVGKEEIERRIFGLRRCEKMPGQAGDP